MDQPRLLLPRAALHRVERGGRLGQLRSVHCLPDGAVSGADRVERRGGGDPPQQDAPVYACLTARGQKVRRTSPIHSLFAQIGRIQNVCRTGTYGFSFLFLTTMFS